MGDEDVKKKYNITPNYKASMPISSQPSLKSLDDISLNLKSQDEGDKKDGEDHPRADSTSNS